MADSGDTTRVLTAGAEAVGQRLDRYLAAQCPGLSRNRIQAALDAGRVRVDGRPRPKSHRLRGGERVELAPLPRERPSARPQDIPLRIVYEDAALAVIDKPAGMVVHPAPGHPDGTLVNALAHRYGSLATASARDDDEAGAGDLRPGIVHRLDRDTSGLLVVALSDEALASLAAQLSARELQRRYRVLSWGRWPASAGLLEGAIGRHARDRKRMAVVRRRGRAARTRYEVEEDFGFCQLCTAELDTGRTHQIRVHFRHHDHPVVGDPIYGDDRRAKRVAPADRSRAAWLVRHLRRQFLHATELRLHHPRSGEELAFRSPLPADLSAVLAELRRTA